VRIRHGFAVLAIAAGAFAVTGAAPAFADAPPVPPGCSFDQATGVETCVTTTTTTSTAGPFYTTGFVPATTTFGGVTGQQICDLYEGNGTPWEYIRLSGLSLKETVTTTTTTERHGLNGKVFDTSTSTSTSLTGIEGYPPDCTI
jgi:hypothetical protein